MNRHQRRRLDALNRHAHPDDFAVLGFDRATLIATAAALAEMDPTVSGATIIMPSGECEFVSGDLLRRGGSA